MTKPRTPERSIAPSDVTLNTVTITVGSSVRGRMLKQRRADLRGGHRARAAVAVAIAVAALGTVTMTALPSRRTSPAVPRRAQVPSAERAAIAAAFGYPYPLRCLTITISPGYPNYARAEVDRTNGCGRYHGYVNASFDRVDGRWRLILDEGQLFVPNYLLTPCRRGQAGC